MSRRRMHLPERDGTQCLPSMSRHLRRPVVGWDAGRTLLTKLHPSTGVRDELD